ncbi:MAG: DUF7169 domain-containing protein [Angustibacter sp.]
MTDPQAAFVALVLAARQLGEALRPAMSVRWEAPSRSSSGGRVPNPTLDTVLDPRRLRVSDEITAASAQMEVVARQLNDRAARLRDAVSDWES